MATIIKPEDWQPTGNIRLEESAKSVVSSENSTSVIAGPGAGKTELLAQRALFLLQTGICKPPQRILAISFKRDAAKTLKDRVASRCTIDQARRFDSYTFDAFCKQLLDRFLMLTPEWCRPPRNYRILFPSRDDWGEFLRSLDPPSSLGGVYAVQALRQDKIERWGPLPLELRDIENIDLWTAIKWWHHCLSEPQIGLTFSMIGRLTEAILCHNVSVLRALRFTYSHVFLDEFQDTTRFQYRLTELAFDDSNSILTAVGDTKQRIMTWAGAEAKVFTWFENQFEANREMLQMNHRSNSRIVQIINDLVKEIEPDAVETICSNSNVKVPDDASEFWLFETNEQEAKFLAEFIANDIKAQTTEERVADDFVLLVRGKANQIENQMKEAFSSSDLRLRNEARQISNIAIQDILTEDLTALVIGLIRLALGVRGQEIYRPVQEALAALLGTDFENSRDMKRLDELARNIVDSIKSLTTKFPANTDMRLFIDTIVDSLGKARLQRTFRQYEDSRYFHALQESLVKLFTEHVVEVTSWQDLVDAVEGKGQVRLMTIHKSKGLEFHTVIVVGLHERSFWGFKKNQAEETNNFFVALSRARERVYFTRSSESGLTTQIQGLVDLLDKANIPTIYPMESRRGRN